jgi:transketolase
MSLAPLAYLLFQNVLVHDPADEQWLGRDRFVLSAGHTSLTLYTVPRRRHTAWVTVS